MSALDVFKHSIAFIKRLILTELDKQGVLNTTLKTEPKKINENEIGWVLTVPAIWDFTAKQFMREAAKRVTIYIGWGRTGLEFVFIIYHPLISQCSVPSLTWFILSKNVRESRRGNQELAIQKHRQNCSQDTE